MKAIQKASTLLDLDLREIIRRAKRRYHLAIPSKVIMADYDNKEGDLYIRFKEVEYSEGEPTEDGLIIVHRDRGDTIAAIEILNVPDLLRN